MITTTPRATAPADLDRDAVLVDAVWLLAHRGDPDVRVVEIDVSASAYDAGHLDGALLWNVYSDLKDPDYATVDAAGFERLLQRSGITPDTTVVCLGYAAALGFWLLRRFGHRDARILDGSREDLLAAQLAPSRSAAPSPTPPSPTQYLLGPGDDRVRATRGRVSRAVEDPRATVLDVRTDAEFRGRAFWPSGGAQPDGRAGHIPTAVHVPIDGLKDERGAFRDSEALRRVFADVDLAADSPIITYCTVGGRAATAWFALVHLLGRTNVRVYDGSWAEWGRTPAAPVARD